MSLNVVLSPHEVPQEITPVHEVHLIGKEEAQILCSSGYAVLLFDTTHPVLVGLGMS